MADLVNGGITGNLAEIFSATVCILKLYDVPKNVLNKS